MGSKAKYRSRRNAQIGTLMAEVAERDAVRADRKKPRTTHSDDADSVTVTMERRDTHERKTVVTQGRLGTYECIRAALAPFDPQSWCVVAISTPRTIRRDLQGPRRSMERPEWQLLGQMKMKEYLP